MDRAGNATVLSQATFGSGSPQPYVVGALVLRSVLNVVRFGPTGQEQWAVGDVPGPLIRYGAGIAVSSYFLGDPGLLGVDRRGNSYYTATVGVADSTTVRGMQPALRLGAHTLMGRGVVVARIGTRHDLLTGRVYLDANGNGRPDAGEGPFAFPLVLEAVQPNLTTFGSADASGRFTMYTDSGTYRLSAPNIPAYYALSQPAGGGAYTGRLAGYGRTDSLRHFGVRPTPNQDAPAAVSPPVAVARSQSFTRSCPISETTACGRHWVWHGFETRSVIG